MRPVGQRVHRLMLPTTLYQLVAIKALRLALIGEGPRLQHPGET